MSVNPYDLRTVVLARHAQHVVLIHFPLALFPAAVAFDCLAQWMKNRTLAAAAYLNLLLAAVSTVRLEEVRRDVKPAPAGRPRVGPGPGRATPDRLRDRGSRPRPFSCPYP